MLLIFNKLQMDLKNNISKLLGTFILIFSLTFSTSSYAANPGGSDDDSRSEDPRSDDDSRSDDGGGDTIPLDGGLSVLLLGAAAFGVKKLRDNKK